MHFIFSNPRISFISIRYFKAPTKKGIEFIQEVIFQSTYVSCFSGGDVLQSCALLTLGSATFEEVLKDVAVNHPIFTSSSTVTGL